MEIWGIVIVTIIVLFLVFLILNLIHTKKSASAKQEKKPEEKKSEPTKEVKVIPQPAKSTQKIELTSRPDFSDMIPEKGESSSSKKQVEYEEINGGRLKVLKPRNGIESDAPSEQKIKTQVNNKIAQELKDLSPEMKTVIFGKVLDKID